MKNTVKVLGIAAIIAIIGFSMVSCGKDGNDPVIEGLVLFGDKYTKMEFEVNEGWNESGHENWNRYLYYYSNGDEYDLSSMLANDKVYVLTYSFSSNIDIDRCSTYFTNWDADWKDPNKQWAAITSYGVINVSNEVIKKNTLYNGKVALIPNSDAAGRNPDGTSWRFDVTNRNVNTPATLYFYTIYLEEVDKEISDDNWTVDGKKFEIADSTYAKKLPTFSDKSDVLRIKTVYGTANYGDFVIQYDLKDYAGKTIKIEMSMDVYLMKAARIAWQINSTDPYYPVVCGFVAPDLNHPELAGGPAIPSGTWSSISGNKIITVPAFDANNNKGRILYLSGQQIEGAETYIANASITITPQ